MSNQVSFPSCGENWRILSFRTTRMEGGGACGFLAKVGTKKEIGHEHGHLLGILAFV